MGSILRFLRRRRDPWGTSSPWKKPSSVRRKLALASAFVTAVIVGGFATHLATGGRLPDFIKTSFVGDMASPIWGTFKFCAFSFGSNCVIDGDTIIYDGQEVRIVGLDAPEISVAGCAQEKLLGYQAKIRLLGFLNSGSPLVRKSGASDEDRYGRKLREVLIDGRSVSDKLISEGLASPWEGHRHDWCNQSY